MKLEGEEALIRKINFANCYGLTLTYVLYCDEMSMFTYSILSHQKKLNL